MKTTGAFLGAAWVASGFPSLLAADARPRYRAAVIGRTGAGDYGHGWDLVFKGLDNVELVAVADADPAGLRKAADRTGAARQYLDYRQMLEREKPDLVSIASRHPDGHLDMGRAALEAGAHLFMEKPMTETVAEADALLEAARQHRRKIAVAHVRRYTADFLRVKALLAEGFAGEIRDVRILGKQDHRVGGEDLMVLGTHDFDLLRFYWGDPRWCFASVTQGGRDLVPEDVKRGREPILVAGDTIHALLAFPGHLQAHWCSIKTGDHWNTSFSPREKWCFEIYGTRRIIAYQSGFGFAYLDSPFLAHKDDTARWRDLPQPAVWPLPGAKLSPAQDLLRAIETDTAPRCSGEDGRWAVEVVAAIYQSQIARRRIALPLQDRQDPLRRFQAAPPASR